MQPLAGSCRLLQAPPGCGVPYSRRQGTLPTDPQGASNIPLQHESLPTAADWPEAAPAGGSLEAAWKPGSLEAGACRIEVALLLPRLASRSLHLVSSCWPLLKRFSDLCVKCSIPLYFATPGDPYPTPSTCTTTVLHSSIYIWFIST